MTEKKKIIDEKIIQKFRKPEYPSKIDGSLSTILSKFFGFVLRITIYIVNELVACGPHTLTHI